MLDATITLRLSSSRREERLLAWVEALARVPGTTRRLRLADVSPALAERCAEVGVELVGAEKFAPGARDVVVLASGDDLPTPHSLVRLVAAVGRDAPVVETRVLPYGAYASGPEDVPTPAPRVCLAVSGSATEDIVSAATVEDAVAAVRSAHQVVQTVDAAAVFRDRRPPGSPEPEQLDLETPPPYGHPAALPSSTLNRLLRRTGLTPPELSRDREDRPFLSVITRTQGTRLLCLEEVLTCLAAQSSRDFEVLLACHRADAAQLDAVRRLLTTLPGWLQERVRVLEVDRPGRSSPLNDALDAAHGRYAVVLDDDDAVTADWVAAFAAAEVWHPGTVLRSVALGLDVKPSTQPGGGGGAGTVPHEAAPAHLIWPEEFSLVDHLWDNASPPMTFAVPRGVFDELGEHFDEKLDTTEDWEFLLRAAIVTGVTSTPAVTAVYRAWVDGEGSRHLHGEAEWAAGRDAVLASIDQQVILLPPGAARDIRNLHQALLDERAEKFRFAGLNEQAADDLRAVNEAVVVLQERISLLEERLARRGQRSRLD